MNELPLRVWELAEGWRLQIDNGFYAWEYGDWTNNSFSGAEHEDQLTAAALAIEAGKEA